MELKDSGTIAYSAKPQELTISVLKDGAMSILQGLVDLGVISIKKSNAAKQKVSLDGDSFESDQKYFEQISGFLEKLDRASKSPRSEWISSKEAGWDV
uniref:Uncharacterized protein n=1 Tax=uncultured bacterium contig00104 TaxID=1181571 RepID=A0A806KT23_9BACT|nr:hypothetical protein [uncultured bacterium contig00104]